MPRQPPRKRFDSPRARGRWLVADARPRWLLADARPRCIPSRAPRLRIVAERAEGAPHTLSEYAVTVAVSRNRRGSPSLRVPATSNCGDGGLLRGWDTTTSTRRLLTPPWYRRAGVWTGCLVGREHARAPTGRRRGHSEVMTLRRFRDTAAVAVRSDKDVRGTLFSSVTSIDRGDRPTRHPGRAPASNYRAERAS